MELGELVAGLGVREAGGAPAGSSGSWGGVRVCDLTEDSRTVVPGSLFIARQGTKADGKAFLEQALGAGAVAVLTDDQALKSPAGFDPPILYSDDVEQACGQMAERFYG